VAGLAGPPARLGNRSTRSTGVRKTIRLRRPSVRRPRTVANHRRRSCCAVNATAGSVPPWFRNTRNGQVQSAMPLSGQSSWSTGQTGSQNSRRSKSGGQVAVREVFAQHALAMCVTAGGGLPDARRHSGLLAAIHTHNEQDTAAQPSLQMRFYARLRGHCLWLISSAWAFKAGDRSACLLCDSSGVLPQRMLDGRVWADWLRGPSAQRADLPSETARI
jgi:hypothetical protein